MEWTPTESLTQILTDAIAQVRTYEKPPRILATAIMVPIQTEVGKAKEEVLTAVSMAMQERERAK